MLKKLIAFVLFGFPLLPSKVTLSCVPDLLRQKLYPSM